MRLRLRNALASALLAALAGPASAQTSDTLVLRMAAMSAVSGLEDAMADSLLAAVPGSALDRAGNVVWTRGTGDPVRIAICPMDEIGYVVGGITSDGYLTLRRVGTTPASPLFDQFLEGQRVTVFGRRGAVAGVVGVRSTHLTRGRTGGADDPFSLDNAYVDVGAVSAAEAGGLGIEVLAPVTRAKRPHRYGPSGRLVAAPFAGARAACAALVSAAGRAPAGAGTTIVAFTRRRHYANDGASFVLIDRGTGVPAANIVLVGGTTAGSGLGGGPQSSADSVGVASGFKQVTAWALPARYPRTPVETVSLADVAQLEQRLVGFLGGAP